MPTAVITPTLPELPVESPFLTIPADVFAGGGFHSLRFSLINRGDEGVLHVRLAPGADWLSLIPGETALGPGERQWVDVRLDIEAAHKAVRAGGPPSAPIRLLFQTLYPTRRKSGNTSAPTGEQEGAVYVQLPVAVCPSCERSLASFLPPDGAKGYRLPAVCPFCFERLRPCPVCGAANSWLARHCVRDQTHVVREGADWPQLGGSPGHEGARPASSMAPALALRWSFPTVAPVRRENTLSWSAPAAAYGLVTAAAATSDGDAQIHAFDAQTGAPLWEAYPLRDPVYPDRGGVALAQGRLFAATVNGLVVALDALRGTRLWEVQAAVKDSSIELHVYGAVTLTLDGSRLLIAAATTSGTGYLICLEGETGKRLWEVPLASTPDATPALADGRAFVHDDGGTLTAVDLATGKVQWTALCGKAGFDAAPLVQDGQVISATLGGDVWCHAAETGKKIWQVTVTSVAFGGTPASDGTLIALPADDGIHLLSAQAGKAVRRYSTRQPVRSAPVSLGSTLLFGCRDGNVYGASAAASLEKLYETGSTRSQIVAAPAYGDGALFVAATNGVLYALSLVNLSPSGREAAPYGG